MSSALKFFAYLFLVTGIISCAYHLYTGYQLTHDDSYRFILKTWTETRSDPLMKDFAKSERESLTAMHGAAQIKNYIGFASLISGFLSFLMFYSQSTILKRTELLEQIYSKLQREALMQHQ